MATTPVHALLTTPFNHTTDFTELADNCERYTEVLVKSDDPAEKLALCGRLASCLALLKPTLNEPIPQHLVAFLTLDSLPEPAREFAPETQALCGYCQTLTQLTLSGMLTRDQQRVIDDLLFELVGVFSDRLKAPRWLRTEQGTVPL